MNKKLFLTAALVALTLGTFAQNHAEERSQHQAVAHERVSEEQLAGLHAGRPCHGGQHGQRGQSAVR